MANQFVQLWRRLLFYVRRNRFDRELEEEMNFHLEMKAGENLVAGMSAEEARYASQRQFGNRAILRESSREMWAARALDMLAQDLRYGARTLWRRKGFTAAAALTLSIGVGANATIFSAVYAVLLKPLPYAEPNQIYSINVVPPVRREQIENLPPRIQDFLEWRGAETSFSSIAALTPAEWNLTGDGEAERVGGARISANFFSLLGVPLAQGRAFASEEEQPGKDRVAVISDGLWRRRYGADPTLVGRSINLNGQSHLVVGIAPATLLVPTVDILHPLLRFSPRIDVWKPIAPTPTELQEENWDMALLARLKSGETLEHGRLQLQTLHNNLNRKLAPDFKLELLIRLTPIREIYSGKARLPLLFVLGASALLLLIACVNIANLFLARVTSRAGEFAVRIALGAGRARLMSQMLTESVLLALVGGVLGALFAAYGTHFLAVYGPDDVRLLASSQLNGVVLLFSAVTSLVAGAISGLIPARHAYRQGAAIGLQEGAKTAIGGIRSRRTQRILVGIEMALGTALLASSGLLLHSYVKVMGADRGYGIERVLAATLTPSGQRYSTGEQKNLYYRGLIESIRSLPGVTAAGAISELPASTGIAGANQTIFHATDTNFERVVLQRPVALIRSVTPGYFAASGSALRAGRFITEQDQTPVAVLSESLAKRLWPGEPLTAVIEHTFREGDVAGPVITVKGIVQDVRPAALDRELFPQIYRPHHQRQNGRMTLVMKTFQDPGTLAANVRAEIKKIDPNVPITAMQTMQEIISASVAQRRFQLILTSLFALAALALGVVGVYGVVSYSVACRTREIGLRIALGAMRSDVLRWVLADGMRPVLIGLVIGLSGAVFIGRALRGFLFGITFTDPWSLGVVGLILLAASGLACYLPARRAAGMDPMVALRQD
jgi:putative ABC transport system permease protein